MFKKSGVALVAAILLLTLTPAAAQAFSPREGTRFNNPWGKFPAKNKLLNKIRHTIDATPRGASIKIAAYSNDRKDVTNALIRADKRGVSVQVLLNDNWTSHQTKRLRRKLGTNIHKKSFLRICKGSCRGRRGNLHSKFYLFSHAGKKHAIVMFGSVNLTGYSAKTQWNDLFTQTGRKAMHGFLSDVFRSMKHDKHRKHPFIQRDVGDFNFNVYPRYKTDARDDPLMRRLRHVQCLGAAGHTGVGKHTMLRINMYGWNGTRGVYIAKQVAKLRRQGCNIRVVQSNAGGRVRTILERNGVLVKSPDYDRNNNGKRDMFTHDKYLILSGKYRGKAGWHVWTGSQNWSDRSLKGDELTVHIPRRGVFWQYRKNFNFVWDKHAKYTKHSRRAAEDSKHNTSANTRARQLELH